MKRKWVRVGLGLLMLSLLSGCATINTPNSPTEKAESVDSKWVVIENADAVRPTDGIAKHIVELKGYTVIDWLDEETLLAYKYSDTVFGEDRGIVKLVVASGEVKQKYETPGTYFEGSVSPDKKILAYMVSGNSQESRQLNILDLTSGKTKIYANKDLPRPYQIDPYIFKQSFRWDGDERAVVTLSGEYNRLRFALLNNQALTYSDYMFSTDEDLAQYPYAQGFSIKGDLMIGVLQLIEGSYVLKGQMGEGILKPLQIKDVINVLPMANRDALIVVQQKKDQLISTLSLTDLEGNSLQKLTQGTQLCNLEIYGNTLIYTERENDTEITLSMYNLINSTENVVTTYTDVWINTIRLSPSGNQLIISFEYGGPHDKGRPVSHLIQLN